MKFDTHNENLINGQRTVFVIVSIIYNNAQHSIGVSLSVVT